MAQWATWVETSFRPLSEVLRRLNAGRAEAERPCEKLYGTVNGTDRKPFDFSVTFCDTL